jgi:hypothetical protein
MVGYFMNNEFQRMWEEAIIELDNMTKDCGLLVKILGHGEYLKHLMNAQQLHVDYKPETTSVEKADVGEPGYSIGAVITN